MAYALGILWPVMAWSAAFAAVACLPGVVALRRGRLRLGRTLLALSVVPVVMLLGWTFADLVDIDRTEPPGAWIREAPWGGMGGLIVAIPFFWSALILVLGAVSVGATVLLDRRRAKRRT